MGKVIVLQNPTISLDKEWKRTTPAEKEIVNVLGQKVTSSFNGRKYEVVCDATRDFPLVPFIIRFVAGLFAVLGTLGIVLLCDCASAKVKSLFDREESVRYIIETEKKEKVEKKTPRNLKWSAINSSDPKIDEYCKEAREEAPKLTGSVDRTLLNHVPRWSAEDFNQRVKTLPPFMFRLISNEAVPGIAVEELSQDQLNALCTAERIPLLTVEQLNKCIKEIDGTLYDKVTKEQLQQLDLSSISFFISIPKDHLKKLFTNLTVDKLKQIHKDDIVWNLLPPQVLAEYLENNSIDKTDALRMFGDYDGRVDIKALAVHLSPQKLAELYYYHYTLRAFEELGPCRSIPFFESLVERDISPHMFRSLFPTESFKTKTETSELFRQIPGKLLAGRITDICLANHHWEALTVNQVLEICASPEPITKAQFNKMFPKTEYGIERFKALPIEKMKQYSNFLNSHLNHLSPAQKLQFAAK